MPDIITRALLESKGIPTRDIVAAIWGRKLSGGYEPAEATGTLPLTFRSNGTALLDYRIYGNTLTTKLNLWEWGNTNYRIDLATPIAANTTLTYAVFKDGIANNAEGIYLYDANGSRILNTLCANSNGNRIYATVTPTRDVHRIELSPMAADALRMLTEGDTPPAEYVSPEITDVQGVGVRTESLLDFVKTYRDGEWGSDVTMTYAVWTTSASELTMSTDFVKTADVPYLFYLRSGLHVLPEGQTSEDIPEEYAVYAGHPVTIDTASSDGVYTINVMLRNGQGTEYEPWTYHTMLVEGSTAPDSYIPYGYKLPMVSRTENLFDPNAKNADNGYIPSSYINENGTIATNYSWNVSEYIEVKPSETYTCAYVSATMARAVVGFYDENKSLVGKSRMFDVNSVTTFITTATTKYVRISYRTDHQTTAMLTKGSTAPDQYIPYHRTDTPIYIGNTQLMKDEYVSYGEKKIYREVGGTLTPTDPPVPLPQLPTFSDTSTVLDYEETPAPEEVWVKYKKGD